MKTTRLSRQEIMRLPEGIKVQTVPRVFDGKTVEFIGTLIFQTRSMQEDDEELFGIWRKGEWITFNVKPGNIIISDPSEIKNPPLSIVRCQYFKPKNNRPDYFTIRVIDKKEDTVYPTTSELRDFMKGSGIKFFQAIVFYDNIKLVREIADPNWQKSIMGKP